MDDDPAPYLQINFERPVPLFGVIVQGSPMVDQYVTSFKILHSHDGSVFHYLTEANSVETPQIFRGPIDNRNPVQTPFQVPIESKAVRVYPLTWHDSIAMRLELLGCDTSPEIVYGKPTTIRPVTQNTTHIPFVEHTERPMCDEPMGLDNGIMSPNQVQVSSFRPPGHTKPTTPYDMLRLSAPVGWSPKLNTVLEYVVFDFLEPRVITGLKTKGGESGWVTAFRVDYSTDQIAWNVIENGTNVPKKFLANFDGYSLRENIFEKPIKARYFKVVPLTWKKSIEMKIEPFGCFKPYPPSVKVPETTTEQPGEPTAPECGVCKGVLVAKSPLAGICKCYSPLFWNGNECISEAECPCMVGHIA